jgi:hypothetical protein
MLIIQEHKDRYFTLTIIAASRCDACSRFVRQVIVITAPVILESQKEILETMEEHEMKKKIKIDSPITPIQLNRKGKANLYEQCREFQRT